MTDQPGNVLEEAFKLFEAVRRRVGDGRDGRAGGDVWSEAVREERAEGVCPHNCPACRAMEAARANGPEVVGHVVEAGQALFAAFQEAVAGYERTRASRPAGEPPEHGTRADRAPREGERGSGGDDPLDIG
ncbi:DUF5304 family protein [Actinocorallia sp. A-T 12471]|uniref:DUF5304 family protein n=1 Tax=Actinocorallia sp. A-T 12471 TaxID=3089813 RepID=UPI0029CD96B0|nr:DUF5304 family protein [Actinocorallia sp. A-T 12471]MDX6743187.1 DUF5304 family protein [Actinocorallia sp. A-T 12471]